MHPALYWRGLLQVRLVEVCIQHYTGVVYCRYVWWRYASSIILAWFIAGKSGGGMHPALYWRGLLQVRLVEVCIQHYTGVVYCRKVWWRYASSIILAWFIAGKSGGGMHPALYWRGLLQESLVEVSRRHCAVDVYCRCVCESVCLALCCRCLLQVCVGECVPGIMLPMFIAGVCGRVCAWHYAVDVYCRCVCESVCLALCCRCLLQVCVGECVPGIMLSMFIAGVSVRVGIWHYAADVCCRYVWWRGCTRCSCRTG